MQLREVGPDRGTSSNRNVAATFTFTCIDVNPGMRTAAAVEWEAAAKLSLLVLALSVLDRGCCNTVHCSSTGCCSSTCCCCCCCGCCSSTRSWWSTGSHPPESLVEESCVSGGYWLCVSYGPKAAIPRNPDGRKKKKKKKRRQTMSTYAPAPFSA